jgi:glyoxylase-like metal-dependent hydrolase (beta-lactamase superfamily II)
MKVVVAVFLALMFVTEAAGVLFAASAEIFSFGVGDFKVHMLSEAQRESGLDILIGLSDGDSAKFIPSGKYPSAVAAYLIESPDGVVMVDTGFGREIPRLMKSIGFAPSGVKTVLITHAHGDHIGGLLSDGKPAFPGAKVIVSKAEYEWSEQLRDTLSKYGDAYETVAPGGIETGGAKIMDGISAIAAYGHTPGHTMFMLESRGQKLLIWGDLTHAMAIQMPRPGVSVTYDSDPVAAARVRADVLKYVSENKIPVAGMHIAYPGAGDISPDAENPGGYKFTPKN